MRLQHTKFLKIVSAALLLSLASLGASSRCAAALINLTPTNGVNSDDSVVLSDLVSGDTMGIAVGDKNFTGFNYSRIGDMPLAEDVRVLGFRDPDGNWGISFQGAFADFPGGAASDALIRYIVDVDPAAADQGVRISDAHIYLGGVGVGGNSVFTVDETFLGRNESMSVFMSSLGGGSQQLHDFTLINPVDTRLFVTKNILANAADNATLPARATVIDQSFSQIPEPAAFVLALLGIVAGGFMRRRQFVARGA